MAGEPSEDGCSMSHVDGEYVGNGPVGDGAMVVDGSVNCGSRRRPFLIGVAGGTASGKVYCILVVLEVPNPVHFYQTLAW